MKRAFAAILCLLLVFVLAACGSATETETAPSGAEEGTDTIMKEGDIFTFATETINGDTFTNDNIKDAKLIIVNLWEPWCGPCVNEMPALEQIYEDYHDTGVEILGVFSTLDQSEDALKIIEENNITYPILKMSREFAAFQTQYVPTTVFLDSDGRLIGSEPLIGAQSYGSWEALVKELLEEVRND